MIPGYTFSSNYLLLLFSFSYSTIGLSTFSFIKNLRKKVFFFLENNKLENYIYIYKYRG